MIEIRKQQSLPIFQKEKDVLFVAVNARSLALAQKLWH